MARFYRKRTKLLGKRPGEAIYIGENESVTCTVNTFCYDESEFTAFEGLEYEQDHLNCWIMVQGISDHELLETLKQKFNIPSVVTADIMNTGLRPKISMWNGNKFISMKSVAFDAAKDQVVSEQICFLIMENTLISFQDSRTGVFLSVINRLRDKIGNVRKKSIHYLLFSLLDCISDSYVLAVQTLADQIETVDSKLSSHTDRDTIQKANALKRELLYFGKSVYPAREIMRILSESTFNGDSDNVKPFFSDLNSNIIQVAETIDIYKEILTEEMNTYHILLNNHLNEIMKVMATVSVIFLPLTLVTGIYGTNFKYIPELSFKYGYLLLWGLLFGVSAFLIIIFKRKKWL